jgi:hypothetical protein
MGLAVGETCGTYANGPALRTKGRQELAAWIEPLACGCLRPFVRACGTSSPATLWGFTDIRTIGVLIWLTCDHPKRKLLVFG